MSSAAPRLSILIPAWGPSVRWEQGLVSVLENRPTQTEVVVAFNGPYADPYDLSDEIVFVDAAPGAGVVAMLNAGLRRCQGAIVHLLASGAEVTPGWTEPAMAHFADPRVAAVAPLLVAQERRERIVAAGLGYRSSGGRIAHGAGRSTQRGGELAGRVLGASLAGAFYRRAALDTSDDGLLDEALGAPLADVDLALQWRRLGLTAVCEPRSTIAVPADEPVLGAVAMGRAAERLFWRNAAEVGAGTIALHALEAARDGWLSGRLLQAAGRLVGRIAGLAEIGPARRHRSRLAERGARQAAAAQAIPRPHVRFDAAHRDEPGPRHQTPVRERGRSER